jgi:hypothetical protein
MLQCDIIIAAKSTGQIIGLNDVLFGDVWLCGGQSNMQVGVWASLDLEITAPPPPLMYVLVELLE